MGDVELEATIFCIYVKPEVEELEHQPSYKTLDL